jgi:hypothetical protein
MVYGILKHLLIFILIHTNTGTSGRTTILGLDGIIRFMLDITDTTNGIIHIHKVGTLVGITTDTLIITTL